MELLPYGENEDDDDQKREMIAIVRKIFHLTQAIRKLEMENRTELRVREKIKLIQENNTHLKRLRVLVTTKLESIGLNDLEECEWLQKLLNMSLAAI